MEHHMSNEPGSVNKTYTEEIVLSQSPSFDEPLVQRNSIACVDCKHNHRKCDRALPSCNHCVNRGKECVYKQRKKKRDMKRKDFSFKDLSPVVVTPDISEIELTRKYTVFQHTEICLENIVGYVPLMPQDRVKDLLLYVRDIGLNKKLHVQHKDVEIALIFALQSTNFVRQGHKDIALRLHDKAREYLHETFDVIDFDVAATYTFLGTYLLSRGELNRAHFLLRNSKDFLDKCNNPYANFVNTLVTGNLIQMADMKNMSLSFKFTTDIFFPYDVAPSVFPLHPTFIDIRAQQMAKIMDEKFRPNMPPVEFEIKKNVLLFYALGIKLQYARSGKNDVHIPTLQIANAITSAASDILFAVSTVWTTTAVVEAAQVQMEYFLQTGDRSMIEKLQQDRLALLRMALREQLTITMHGEFIKQLETFIETYEALFQVN